MSDTATITTTPCEEAHAWLREQHPRMGDYAHDVLDGRRALSGADLRGTAKRYGRTYHRARKAAAEAIEEFGGHIRRHPRTGRLTVSWGDVPDGARRAECSLGECWTY